MKVKAIVMMVVAGCAVSMLTGCGVPKEEHEAKLAELNTAWQEIETLKTSNTELEEKLTAETGKVKAANVKVEDAKADLKASQKKESATASALASEKSKVTRMEQDVASANSAKDRAEEETLSVEGKLETLQSEHMDLQQKLEEFKRNLQGLDSLNASSMAVEDAGSIEDMMGAEPMTDSSESAADLLDAMSAE